MSTFGPRRSDGFYQISRGFLSFSILKEIFNCNIEGTQFPSIFDFSALEGILKRVRGEKSLGLSKQPPSIPKTVMFESRKKSWKR